MAVALSYQLSHAGIPVRDSRVSHTGSRLIRATFENRSMIPWCCRVHPPLKAYKSVGFVSNEVVLSRDSPRVRFEKGDMHWKSRSCKLFQFP